MSDESTSAPMIDIDLSSAPLEFTPIRPGIYTVLIEEPPTVEPNSNKDGHNLVVNFKIVDSGEFEGKKLRTWLSLKPNALMSLKRFVKALGRDENQRINIEEFRASLPGQTLKVEVARDTYKDKGGQMKEVDKVKDFIFTK